MRWVKYRFSSDMKRYADHHIIKKTLKLSIQGRSEVSIEGPMFQLILLLETIVRTNVSNNEGSMFQYNVSIETVVRAMFPRNPLKFPRNPMFQLRKLKLETQSMFQLKQLKSLTIKVQS